MSTAAVGTPSVTTSGASSFIASPIIEPLRIKIDLTTYEIELKLFIVLDKEVYEDYLAIYRALIS